MLGVQVFVCTNNNNRKLAIIDRNALWGGSLNILFQSNSREITRRTEGDNHAQVFLNSKIYFLVFLQNLCKNTRKGYLCRKLPKLAGSDRGFIPTNTPTIPSQSKAPSGRISFLRGTKS